MAEPLKHFFDRALVERIARSFVAACAGFPRARFVAEATRGLEEHALLARGEHVAEALRRALPRDTERALELVVASLGPELVRTEGTGMGVFFYLPHSILVARHGLDHFEAAMRAQHAITRRFTAEFSIRPFLERYPRRTLDRLREWARDPNPHVRRLVSEGTRPRLPWAPRLRAFRADPRPVLELLELLRDDPEPYVRRSVANHLNDLGKDHPELLLATCARWMQDAPPGRAWIVRHALRWLVKRGEPRALAILGFEGPADLGVTAKISPRRVRLGGAVEVTLDVRNRTRTSQRAVVDLAVHFVKAHGATRPRVFKVRPLSLAPGERATLRKRISFAPMTTRTHRPGRHRIEILLNGRAVPVGDVDVLA